MDFPQLFFYIWRMKAKWPIFILITSLTLLCVNQSQVFTPNQEIVLKFNKEVTFSETQEAIAVLKEQLQILGVHNIQLDEETNGELKITYYSDLDVSVIKQKLSEYQKILVGYAQGKDQLPKNPSNSNDYNIDVFEIKDAVDLDLSSKGYIPNDKTDNDRSFNPKLYVFFNSMETNDRPDLSEMVLKCYGNNVILIKNTSHKIPEVRAGPTA